MKLGLLLALCVSVVGTASGITKPPLLWPLPQSYSHGLGIASLPTTLTGFFNAPDGSTPLLGRAFARYSKTVFRGCGSSTNASPVVSPATVSHLTFSIDMPNAEGPEEHMDEGYQMHVPVSGRALVHARTQWGALRALETFSQAVVNCTVVGLPLSVADAPRFTHRGMMLDLARMYWTLEGVRSVIDAMVYSKLNVLHLHLTDSEAFPVESTALNATALAYRPADGCRTLSANGSHPPSGAGEHPQRCTYSQDELRALVAYATDRGVRVVPEFDMPSHTGWTETAAEKVPGFPALNCSLGDGFSGLGSDKSFYLDPLANSTWAVLEPFLREMAAIFPESRVHIGTDEVYWRCYNTSATLRAAVLKAGKQLDDDGFKWLLRGFINRVQKLLTSLGKTSIVWNEGFDTYGPGNHGWQIKGPEGRTFSINKELSPNTVVEFWEGGNGNQYDPATGRPVASNPQGALAHGNSALVTNYLPMSTPHWTRNLTLKYAAGVYGMAVSTNNTCTWTDGSATPNCTCYQESAPVSPTNWSGAGHEQRAPNQKACYDIPEDLDVLDGRGAYQRLLGGEACLWGINFPWGTGTNSSNVHERAWPGGLALAERLWSARNITQWQRAVPRLAAQMHRLKQRGIPVNVTPWVLDI